MSFEQQHTPSQDPISQNNLQQLIANALYHSHHTDNVSAEASIWRAVVIQSLLDAINQTNRTEAKLYKKEAQQWFNMNNKDYLWVCEAAGLDPVKVLRLARKTMAQNRLFEKQKTSREKASVDRSTKKEVTCALA